MGSLCIFGVVQDWYCLIGSLVIWHGHSLLTHRTWHLFTCTLVLHVHTWYLFTHTLVIHVCMLHVHSIS